MWTSNKLGSIPYLLYSESVIRKYYVKLISEWYDAYQCKQKGVYCFVRTGRCISVAAIYNSDFTTLKQPLLFFRLLSIIQTNLKKSISITFVHNDQFFFWIFKILEFALGVRKETKISATCHPRFLLKSWMHF